MAKPTFQQVKTRALAVRPSSNRPGLFSDPGKLLEGAGDLAVDLSKRGMNYVRTRTPSQVGTDISNVAGSAYGAAERGVRSAMADPSAAAGEAVQLAADTALAVPQSLMAMGDLRAQAAALRRRGDEAGARRLEGLAAMTALGAIPAVGKAAKAGKVVEKDTARLIEEYGDDWVAPIGHNNPPSAKKPVAKKVDIATRLLTKYPEARSVRPAELAFDPRIEKRKGELGKIRELNVHTTPRDMKPIPEVSIFDFEGKPYVTSMSDLSAAGKDVVGINDVLFKEPVRLRGGQDWMFDNDEVWASEAKAAQRHVDLAEYLKGLTGENPIFLPWTMGPKSINFSHQPRTIQYQYANANMDFSDRSSLASSIKNILPDWRSFDDPESAQMFMGAEGKRRAALNKLMDKYRTRGGIGEGEAIYAATDLDQIGAPLTSLRNVGLIIPERGVSRSTHPDYTGNVPGEGLGRLKEKNLGALALAPDIMQEAGITDPFDFPVGVVPGVKSPMRAYQMGPKGGILDYDTLRIIEQILAKDKMP
jgi:hypothetical protein